MHRIVHDNYNNSHGIKILKILKLVHDSDYILHDNKILELHKLDHDNYNILHEIKISKAILENNNYSSVDCGACEEFPIAVAVVVPSFFLLVCFLPFVVFDFLELFSPFGMALSAAFFRYMSLHCVP